MQESGEDLDAAVTLQLKEAGARVKRLREFRRLTLNTLAEQANVGVQTLVRIEEGSPGVALLNLQKVLTVLGAPLQVAPRAPRGDEPSTQPISHVADPAVVARVEQAAQAAMQQLRKLGTKRQPFDFPADYGESLKALISQFLAGQLQSSGQASASLLLDDADVGGPLNALGAVGWTLRLRHSRQLVNRDGSLASFDELTNAHLHATRQAALTAWRELFIAGKLNMPVDAVPVFRDGDALRL